MTLTVGSIGTGLAPVNSISEENVDLPLEVHGDSPGGTTIPAAPGAGQMEGDGA